MGGVARGQTPYPAVKGRLPVRRDSASPGTFEPMTRPFHDSGHKSKPSAADIVRGVVRFHGSEQGFLREMLGVHARLGGASSAAILRMVEPGRVDAVCEWNDPASPPTDHAWMAVAAEIVGELAGADRPGVAHQVEHGWVVVVPLAALEEPGAAAAFFLGPVSEDEAEKSRARLELGVVTLWAHRVLSKHRADGPGAALVRKGVEIAAAVMSKPDLRGAGTALVNELASALGADRVALGIARGGARRWMRVEAISGVERVHRSMSIVPGLEAAMEECAEQDQEIILPADSDATVISRAHREFAARNGSAALASLPVRSADTDDPIAGVVTVIGAADRPMGLGEVEFVRLTLELVTAHLAACRIRSGWIGARAARSARRAAGRFIGPDRALAKLAAIIAALGLIASLAIRAPERIGAPATVMAAESRICSAPAESIVVSIDVEPGDAIRAGETILAQLDESAVRLELAESRARAGALEQSEAAARGKGDTAEAQIARAQRDEAAARIALLTDRLGRMRIVAPIDGVVVRAPDRSRIGAVVGAGEPLFEVASTDGLRFEARAPVRWIKEIVPGLRGRLTLTGRPGPDVDGVIETAEPVVRTGAHGEPGDAFLVWGRIEHPPEWARAGMEGVVRFEVGTAPVLVIWTRRVADTIRAWGWW